MPFTRKSKRDGHPRSDQLETDRRRVWFIDVLVRWTGMEASVQTELKNSFGVKWRISAAAAQELPRLVLFPNIFTWRK